MGILSAIFGTSKPTPDQQYNTLHDDGIRAMQIGEMPYAVKCFMAALELKREPATTALLAEVHLRMGNHTEALPLLQELHRLDAANKRVHLLLIETLGRLGHYEEERTAASEFLAQEPTHPAALYLAAEADHGTGNHLAAIAHLTQSLTHEPNMLQAHRLRATILAEMQQWNEALADAEVLLHNQPDDEDHLTLHAQILTAIGRHEEAVADYEHLIALNPFARTATLALGRLYVTLTRYDKALALYDDAIECQPDFAEAYKQRGAIKHHLHDDAGAADDLKKALELAPANEVVPDGEYTNMENAMNDRYRAMNPYGF